MREEPTLTASPHLRCALLCCAVRRRWQSSRHGLSHRAGALLRDRAQIRPRPLSCPFPVAHPRRVVRLPCVPLCLFVFLGRQTELAKALAEFLFDDSNAMVRIDMSEGPPPTLPRRTPQRDRHPEHTTDCRLCASPLSPERLCSPPPFSRSPAEPLSAPPCPSHPSPAVSLPRSTWRGTRCPG